MSTIFDWEMLRMSCGVAVGFGLLLFAHELGHFLVARCYGVRAETFSLGFGPALVSVVREGTEYHIRAVPLGGYLRLAGEAASEHRTGAPEEFQSKSRWIQLQVFIGGPLMNVLVAWLILTGVALYGKEEPRFENEAPVLGAVLAGSPAEAAGLRIRDRILAVGGNAVPTWKEFYQGVFPINVPLPVDVERQGTRFRLQVTLYKGVQLDDAMGVAPVMRPTVELVVAGGAAERAGLNAGDVINAVDGEPMIPAAVIQRVRRSAAKTVVFTIERQGREVELPIVPIDREGQGFIGAQIGFSDFQHVRPGITQALSDGAEDLREYVAVWLGPPRSASNVKQLTGPAKLESLINLTPWRELFRLIAFASILLAIANLFPAVGSDGGPMTIAVVEAVTRRPLSARAGERILLGGTAVLLAAGLQVVVNDLGRISWLVR
jgi:regulator of sigma E protease